jgi:hypothetical protein
MKHIRTKRYSQIAQDVIEDRQYITPQHAERLLGNNELKIQMIQQGRLLTVEINGNFYKMGYEKSHGYYLENMI